MLYLQRRAVVMVITLELMKDSTALLDLKELVQLALKASHVFIEVTFHLVD